MASLYEDRWIVCTPTYLIVRGYYFPMGRAKRIPLERVYGVEEESMRPLSGLFRIWGTSSLRYWFHLDPRRPRKKVAFVLDVGALIRPVITPDDPDALRDTLKEHGVHIT
jgi:hypothetical protein